MSAILPSNCLKKHLEIHFQLILKAFYDKTNLKGTKTVYHENLGLKESVYKYE